MSDTEYTPTTEQVETAYSHDPEEEYRDPVGYGYRVNENRRGFRRWLAEREADIRRDQILKDAEIAFTESRRAIAWDSERAQTAERIQRAIRAQIGDTNEQ